MSSRLKSSVEELRIRIVKPARIFTLHLGQSLFYKGYADPDVRQEPIPSNEGIQVYADTMFLYGADGPSIVKDSIAPFFTGEGFSQHIADPCIGVEEAAASNLAYCLEAGDYLFVQWRAKDFASAEKGLEAFARQIWREDKRGEGPWILRIVAEDGDIGYQGLRRSFKDLGYTSTP